MLTKDAIIEKYQNGQIEWRIPIEWHEFGSYRRHGEAIQYYPTGEVKLRRTYVHGLEQGDEIIYYPDGSVMSVLPFVDGRRQGLHVFNHSGGAKEECQYENDVRVPGSITRTDKDGKQVKEKPQDAPERRGDAEPKKILPGDHVPPALAR